MFAFAEAEFHFDFAAGEIEFEGNEAVAFLLQEAGEAVEFAAVHEDFFGAVRLVGVEAGGGGGVGLDAHAVDEEFAVFEGGVGFGEAGVAGAAAFDFAAGEGEADFPRVEDVVFVAGFSIGGESALAGILPRSHGAVGRRGRLKGEERAAHFRLGSRQRAQFGGELAFGNFLERQVEVVHIQRVRLNQRALAGVQLADALGNHVDEQRNVGHSFLGFFQIIRVHGIPPDTKRVQSN